MKVLETQLGRDIRAADRDLAWDAYRLCGPARERATAAEARATAAETAHQAARSEVIAALDDWKARARAAARSAQAADAEARAADRRAAEADAKAAALLAGRRVCVKERAGVVEHIDDWFAASLGRATRRLLDCLAAGES